MGPRSKSNINQKRIRNSNPSVISISAPSAAAFATGKSTEPRRLRCWFQPEYSIDKAGTLNFSGNGEKAKLEEEKDRDLSATLEGEILLGDK